MNRKSTETAGTRNRTDRGAGRLARSSEPEVRGDRGASEDAQRTGATGLLSTDELEKLIREEFEQTALPTAPELRGYHLCWMTTTSSYDTVQKRMRLGYEIVRSSELPGFDPSNGQRLAQHEGAITCNEMVLMKIPEVRYQALMSYFHHKRPLQEEEALHLKVEEQTTSQTDSSGKPLGLVEGDGLTDWKRDTNAAQDARPVFS